MTMSLHMIELLPDMPALMRFLRGQGLATADGDDDLGYGVHAWLAAAFGELAPKPWRLFADRKRPPRLLAYTIHDADLLRGRLREFADPAVCAVCPDADVSLSAKRMPDWQPGRRLGFEVQCCPVGRENRSGVEKDLALLHGDGSEEERHDRHQIYCEWARTRLEGSGAATVSSIAVEGFRLVSQRRRASRQPGGRQITRLIRPQVLLRGTWTVENTDAFSQLLATGIGRHRAFGYGMVLLRPPA
jgi:CRISPR system Cascade subunit CasE